MSKNIEKLSFRETTPEEYHPYERMNITGVKGLTEAVISTLKA